MKGNIIIIGGGASCIAFIDALLKKKVIDISITIVEKAEEIGPGNAYSSDLTSNILNTKAGYITIFKNYPSDFFNWICCNKYKWKIKYSELEINHDTYVPRSLFGMYMQDAFSYICTRAYHIGLNIKIIRGEAVSIKQIMADRVSVTTKDGLVVEGDKIILACGTQQRSEASHPHSKGVILSPYPTKDLISKVSADEKIAVIGTRLSAIDCIIALLENGHKGAITVYSRSGFFPYVRGTQGRYKNAYINTNYIIKNYSTLDFNDLNSLYIKERERYKRLKKELFLKIYRYPMSQSVP